MQRIGRKSEYAIHYMDKTGTLTAGQPKVTDIIASNGFDQNHLLSIAASVESQSEHPLA